MHISSVRLGHANNSSSSHSILLGSTAPQIITCERSRFGWEWFHLRDRAWKANYLSTLIFMTLTNSSQGSSSMSPEAARIVAKELTGDDPLNGVGDDYIYIDHQSVPTMPKVFGKKYHDIEFLREFTDHILEHPEITIRGGNDNESEGDPVGDEEAEPDLFDKGRRIPVFDGKPHPFFSEESGEDWVRRYPYDYDDTLVGRKDGDWWVLYNEQTGAKIRLSFKEKPEPYAPKTPELVDLKITDRCERGCHYCYQSSTPDGKDAELEKVHRLLYDLEDAKVFEVALGGGEPTRHPHFAAILQQAREFGITPNFSTADTNWMYDEKIAKAVIECCGSFAVSDPRAIEEIVAWNVKAERHGYSRIPKATLQIPLGCYHEAVVRDALEKARVLNLPVTLLGYKNFGRAEGLHPYPYAWVLDYMTQDQEKGFRFGADSVFVSEFGDELKKQGVSEKLMVNVEGAHSCYIDAVKNVMGPSSFTKDLHPIDVSRALFDKFPYAKESP